MATSASGLNDTNELADPSLSTMLNSEFAALKATNYLQYEKSHSAGYILSLAPTNSVTYGPVVLVVNKVSIWLSLIFKIDWFNFSCNS